MQKPFAKRLDERFLACPAPEECRLLLSRRPATQRGEFAASKETIRQREPFNWPHLLDVDADFATACECNHRALTGVRKIEVKLGSGSDEIGLSIRRPLENQVVRRAAH